MFTCFVTTSNILHEALSSAELTQTQDGLNVWFLFTTGVHTIMQIMIIQPVYKGKVIASCDKNMEMCLKGNDRLSQKQCFSYLGGIIFKWCIYYGCRDGRCMTY